VTRPVRVGLVGCGRLAERGYLPALAQTGSVSLVAVADLDLARCEALAPGVPAHATADDLLASADVELLVLAHAASAHVADACAAADAGVACLVEKPPARAAEEARRLVGLEPAAWVGFNRRFEPSIATMRAQLAAAPPAALELELSILPSAWAAFDGSESSLLDLGPHLVDLALWLTGREPSRVRVQQVTEHDSVFSLDLGDMDASVRVSHRNAWHERVVARDARGRAVARFERGGLARRLAARARSGRPGPLVDSLAEQLAAVATAVRGGPVDSRLAGAAEGVAVLAVLDAVAAAEDAGWVEL
jgi:predicted dehydrogenase